MKLCLLCIALYVICINRFANAAVAIQPYVEKPPELACEEGCYVPELQRVLPYEEPYSPQDGKSCMQYICKTNNETIIETCGAIGVPDGCTRVPGDKYKPYSECCDTVYCENST